jgi:hypothetical protein
MNSGDFPVFITIRRPPSISMHSRLRRAVGSERSARPAENKQPLAMLSQVAKWSTVDLLLSCH